MTKPGAKLDKGKPRMSLVSPRALVELAKVMTFGAAKYGDYNYLGGMDWTRLLDANLRHLNAFIIGEDLDKESGLHHLAHAAANSLILLEYVILNKGKDDRYKNPLDK